MNITIVAAIIGGIFLLLSVIIQGLFAVVLFYISRDLKSVKHQTNSMQEVMQAQATKLGENVGEKRGVAKEKARALEEDSNA